LLGDGAPPPRPSAPLEVVEGRLADVLPFDPVVHEETVVFRRQHRVDEMGRDLAQGPPGKLYLDVLVFSLIEIFPDLDERGRLGIVGFQQGDVRHVRMGHPRLVDGHAAPDQESEEKGDEEELSFVHLRVTNPSAWQVIRAGTKKSLETITWMSRDLSVEPDVSP